MEAAAPMTLKILTPDGIFAQAGCDSAILTMRDGVEGKGGGLIGVQKDHTPAVLALGEGIVRGSLGGKTVLTACVSGGFASVKDNVITVITDTLPR